MDISDILKCKCCKDIFPEDISLAQPLYMALMLKYHPDKCSDPRAAEASAVINELYGKLKKAHTFKEMLFRCGSRAIEIKYLMSLTQEYGMEYIGERNVYFLIRNELADCYIDSEAKTDLFFREYLPQQILAQAEVFLPLVTHIFNTDEGLLIETCKRSGELPLSRILAFYGGRPDSRHAAWIISRLLGICCYAETRGIVWNCLAEENLFIDPAEHTVRVGGGWWFAAREGSRMTGVQSGVYESLSSLTKTDGIAQHITDLECVKAVARRILPDDAPDAVKKYAESICSSSAFEEMEKWENVIIDGFGGRKFTHMNVRLPDISG
ncbi:MAG: J domain-containing protein [Ruminococcus sp.]|uniref:J domain-containing protein n=1 Tax=Ruminococcus sp. TaxID=41978 RepID=UPI0025D47673|nr:J domain-containing protein [Ruminococcus sp.]MCR4795799.1 J domain-containing protein [Ruminococcus sp.]